MGSYHSGGGGGPLIGGAMKHGLGFPWSGAVFAAIFATQVGLCTAKLAGPCSLASAREDPVQCMAHVQSSTVVLPMLTKSLKAFWQENVGSKFKHSNVQGVAIAILASVMPPEPKYDASVHEKLMPISGMWCSNFCSQLLTATEGKLPACLLASLLL